MEYSATYSGVPTESCLSRREFWGLLDKLSLSQSLQSPRPWLFLEFLGAVTKDSLSHLDEEGKEVSPANVVQGLARKGWLTPQTNKDSCPHLPGLLASLAALAGQVPSKVSLCWTQSEGLGQAQQGGQPGMLCCAETLPVPFRWHIREEQTGAGYQGQLLP